ncbi:MAG: SurA N-terminal domain-containing protein, partial [Gallionellaceae bacterium]
MFDMVHENKRFVQVILALIILPFAFWGVNSTRDSDGDALATVNGEEIYQQEFDNTLRQQQGTMRQRMGDKFDPTLFDKPEIKQSILDNLITQRLLTKQAATTGLMISDEQLAQIIGDIGAFQKDGKFDNDIFKSVLRSQKLTPLEFEARVQEQFG